MEETRTLIVTQPEGDRFAQEHQGGLAIYGDKEHAAVQHQFGGQVVHTTAPERPLVHMVCWDEDDSCNVELSGRVTLAGDETAPVYVQMRHEFTNNHQQSHVIEPMDHSLKVDTQLAQPIHHALQMRTPLQLRFCNPWHIVSDYVLEINLGGNRVISVGLRGATIATPQPCEEPCPPAAVSKEQP